MKKITLQLMVLITSLCYAQQEQMVSRYMFNGLYLNPAYAGSNNFWNSSLLYRGQWVGFEGAPKTQLLSIDGPLAKNKMGLGFILSNDKIGVTNETDLLCNYAYKITLDKDVIAFGLKAGVSMYRATFSDLVYWDNADPKYNQNQNGIFVPKFGFGALYLSEKWYGGFSIPALIAWDKNHTFSMDINQSSFVRKHYFLTGGVVINLNEQFKFKPSLLLKYTESAPVQADINCAVIYKNFILAGISYRTGDALVAMVEYVANSKFRIGYAFDYTYTDFRRYSNGTHELMISYDFGTKQENYVPRFF